MTTSKKTIPIDAPDDPAAPAIAEKPTTAKAAPAAVEDAAATAGGGAPVDEPEALRQERDRLADSLLRLRAEFDNYRKRAARELTEARVSAQGDLFVDLLPVLDNLERALDAAEHHEEGKVLQGVQLTRDQFVRLLAKAGVEEVAGVGSPFDPMIHEAVAVQPSELAEGVVSAILERGYRQGAQVLRPARVVVSAGSDEAATPGDTAAAAGVAGPSETPASG